MDIDKFNELLLKTETEITTPDGREGAYIPPLSMVERLVNWMASDPIYEKPGIISLRMYACRCNLEPC